MVDRCCGWLFVLLGIGVTVGAWMMPRFEERGASIYEAPGILPALLGLALTLAGLVLATRRIGSDLPEERESAILTSGDMRKRSAVALFLTVTYATLLFGNIPFITATSIFIFTFIIVFEWPNLSAENTPLRQRFLHVLIAAVIALTAGVFSHYLFQTVFLVQLP